MDKHFFGYTQRLTPYSPYEFLVVDDFGNLVYSQWNWHAGKA